MTTLKTDAVLRGVLVLADMRGKWRTEQAGRQPFVKHQFEYVLNCINELANALESSGLLIACGHARGLSDAFNMAPVDPSNGDRIIEGKSFSFSTHHLERLISVIPEEAATKRFLAIDPKYVANYEQTSTLMGENVELVFVDASYDISEAGKCLALSRATSTVFHLMRAMEDAVKVVGVKINATVSNANGETLPWGIIMSNIKVKIDAMAKGGGQDKWYKIHALLHSVNRAFRTKTAHPTGKYTQEEAESAFHATKSFMQELAALCLSP